MPLGAVHWEMAVTSGPLLTRLQPHCLVIGMIAMLFDPCPNFTFHTEKGFAPLVCLIFFPFVVPPDGDPSRRPEVQRFGSLSPRQSRPSHPLPERPLLPVLGRDLLAVSFLRWMSQPIFDV
jgi:hypothetical protein